MILFRPEAARELAAKVARFPYRVVYILAGPNIDVIAVAHAKRRPAYWRDRTR